MENAAILIFLAMTLAFASGAVVLTARVMATGLATGPASSGTRLGPAADIMRRYQFREGYLLTDVDADDAFLDPDVDRTAALARLTEALQRLSPEFGPHFAALQSRGEAFLIDGRIGSDAVSISGRLEDGQTLTLAVGPAGSASGRQVVEAAMLHALQNELQDLRAALDCGVVPMWREDADHCVTWANDAYLDLVKRLRGGDTPGWPLPRIFAKDLEPAPADGTVRRCALGMPDRDEACWFDITFDPLPGGSGLFIAQPADRLVRAETTLREFHQTTTKTFAALPVGLAVFDKKRQLVTFNPALVALTQAGPEFLSARPDLRAFLDRLRDRKRMPEPRDYKSWRNQIAQLEQGAENGTYRQLWELPEGKTFRVMGRPHPDGAIAFMFEDISAEVSLTRQFRADLEMFQGILDTVPAALAVFQADGSMVGANEGYGRLWGQDPQILAQMPHLTQAMEDWSAKSKDSTIWSDIHAFVGHEVDRAPWVAEIETIKGMRLAVRVAPTRGRATVVQFLPLDLNLADPLAIYGPDEPTPIMDAVRAKVKVGKKQRRA